MNPFESNPFTVLTLIAAPAVLTNASSVLALGTSNRFARAIDRARALSVQLEKPDAEADPLTPLRIRQLDRTETRAILLLHALRAFYFGLGAFASAALVSVLGAGAASVARPSVFHFAVALALLTGVSGVGGLVFGCTLLMRETRLALQNVSEEAALIRGRFAAFARVSGPDEEP